MQREGDVRFSVIVPVYNVQQYLAACVGSVVGQAGAPDWECILVDDGSTDRSGKMCDAFAETCPGVVALHRENGGLPAARNTGIEAARGEWLLFLDSDDLWPAGMLEHLRAALDAHPGYDWYIGRYRELDEATGAISEPRADRFAPGPCAERDYAARTKRLYDSAGWSVWKYCLRRRFLEEHRLHFWNAVRWAEDWPFDLMLLKHCEAMYFLDVAMAVYRQGRAGSLVNARNLPARLESTANACELFRRRFAKGRFTAAEQEEILHRAAGVFWPVARAAACRDKATRRACEKGILRCKPLWRYGREQAEGCYNWKVFARLLRAFGPRFALWAGSLGKG